jgi:hypothetical protein
MDSLQVDYSRIKDRLRSLQPKNRMSMRDAHLAVLREELRAAHKRGVSFSILSDELKAVGILISALTLSKLLRGNKAKRRVQRHVRSGTSESLQRDNSTTPK